ncbi:sensor histidine kinase [Paenibacillus sp. CAU 1782]
MAGTITLLRYLFIILPFMYTFFHSGMIQDALFFVYFFAMLLMVQARGKLPHRMEFLLVPVELALILIAGLAYGDVIHLWLFSVLISLLDGGGRNMLVRAPLLLLSYLTLIRLTYFLDPMYQFALHIMFSVTLLLGYTLERIQKQNETLEIVYDELRSKHYELAEAKRRMGIDAKQLEHLAQANERNRIARDIHDELGHRLIRVKMMSEALVHMYDANPGGAGKLVAQIRDQLAEGMETLRTTVHRLQPAPEETQRYSLDRLITEFADSSGIDVTLQIQGQPYPLYPSEELTLYRNAQEAMTNAVRHGGATKIAVGLHFAKDAIVFSVSNNGKAMAATDKRNNGMGFAGMEERARRHGGRIEVQTSEPFKVTTYLPHRRQES